MQTSIGIVGLPNVGKSTLFKALTNKQVDIQNYPFTTIDPNVGVVAVPDERVDALAMMSDSKKKIYTTIEFYDIAGLVKGAAQGEGLGNKFLANIREVDAIAHVVRVFEDKNITHVHNKIDALCLETLEYLFNASHAAKSNKLNYLNTANQKLDLCKFFLQLAGEKKIIKNEKYIPLSDPLQEIGRMLGGWIRQIERETQR